jgi:hypothetical protein
MEEVVEAQSPSNAAKVAKKKPQAAQVESDERLARIMDESDMPTLNYDPKKDTNAQMNDRIFARRNLKQLKRNADAKIVEKEEEEQQSDSEEEEQSDSDEGQDSEA